VRLYDRLFTIPDPDETEGDFREYLNPDSLVTVSDAMIEPSVRDDPPGSRYQFERMGYFCSDVVDSAAGAHVFKRTVTLRDTWTRTREPAGEEKANRPERTESGARPSARERSAPEATERTTRPRMPAETTRTPALDARRDRLRTELGLSDEESTILTRDEATVGLFEAALATGASARGTANWIIHELPRETQDLAPAELPFGGEALGELVKLVDGGTVSSSGGREVLARMVRGGGAPGAIVEELGLQQVSDPDALLPLVEEVLAAHPGKVEEYRGGKAGLMGFFIGQVMRRSGGKANPELARELFEKRMG
jgi:glutaminyl-tRNA synthetase